jgi:hypothetical protein
VGDLEWLAEEVIFYSISSEPNGKSQFCESVIEPLRLRRVRDVS